MDKEEEKRSESSNNSQNSNNSENSNNSQSSRRTYGWLPDLPSVETNYFMVASSMKKFPSKKILTDFLPPVYDQGHLGSCTANALGAAFQYEQRKSNFKDFVPSRLFIYYNERKLEGTIDYDSGATISDGIKTLTDDGVCSETLWPYEIDKFKDEPSREAYMDASKHQVVASRRVPASIEGFKTMINMGLPVVFGFTVYSSFETPEVAKSGIMPLPTKKDKMVGGHAVMCVGYDDKMKNGKTVGYLKIRNSWGANWGQDGYFWMPYVYVSKLKLASDFWVIMKNEDSMEKLNRQLSKKNSFFEKINFFNMY